MRVQGCRCHASAPTLSCVNRPCGPCSVCLCHHPFSLLLQLCFRPATFACRAWAAFDDELLVLNYEEGEEGSDGAEGKDYL